MSSTALHALVDAAAALHGAAPAGGPAAAAPSLHPHAGGPPLRIKSNLLDAALAMAAADATDSPTAPSSGPQQPQPDGPAAAAVDGHDSAAAADGSDSPAAPGAVGANDPPATTSQGMETITGAPLSGFAALLAGERDDVDEPDSDPAPAVADAPQAEPPADTDVAITSAHMQSEAPSSEPGTVQPTDGPSGAAPAQQESEGIAAVHSHDLGPAAEKQLVDVGAAAEGEIATGGGGEAEEQAPVQPDAASLMDLDNMQLGDMSALLGDSDAEQPQSTPPDNDAPGPPPEQG